jgi:hypothetical protein
MDLLVAIVMDDLTNCQTGFRIEDLLVTICDRWFYKLSDRFSDRKFNI